MKRKVLSLVILVAMVVTMLPSAFGNAYPLQNPAPAANRPVWNFQYQEIGKLGNGDILAKLNVFINHTDNFISGSIDFGIDPTVARACKPDGTYSSAKGDIRAFATGVDRFGTTNSIDSTQGGWFEEGPTSYSATTGEFYTDGLITADYSKLNNPAVPDLGGGPWDVLFNGTDMGFPVSGNMNMLSFNIRVVAGHKFVNNDLNFNMQPNLNIVANMDGTGKGLDYVNVLDPIYLPVTIHNHVKGTVSIPAGWNANGETIAISANGSQTHSQDVVVANNSASYDFDVVTYSNEAQNIPLVEANTSLNVTASINDARFTSPITLGTANLNPDAAANIVLDGAFVAKDVTVSGTISLPAAAPAGGLSLTIGKGTAYEQALTIAEGDTSALYSFVISGASAITPFDLYVDINGSDKYITPELIGNVKNTQGDVTLDKTLGSSPVIGGTISLPNGKVAPAGGINLTVYGKNSAYTQDITIPEGGTSAQYSFAISSTATVSLNLFVDVKNDSEYIATQAIGTANNTAGDVTLDKTLEMPLSWIPLSGTITLPNDQSAKAGGLDVTVVATGGLVDYMQEVVVPAGQKSLGYTVNVNGGDPNKVLQVYYYIHSTNTDYVRQWKVATIDFSDGQPKTLDITIKEIASMSGTITLPYGDQAAADMHVTVIATGSSLTVDGAPLNYYADCYIPKDATSGEYTLNIRPDEEASTLKVYYYIADANSIYTRQRTINYTAETGKVVTTGLDTTLMRVRTISGTITMPNSAAGGEKVTVIASTTINGVVKSYYGVAEFEAGATTADYTIKVSAEDTLSNNFTVWYYVQDPDSLYVRSSMNTLDPYLTITSMVANVTGKDFALVTKPVGP